MAKKMQNYPVTKEFMVNCYLFSLYHANTDMPGFENSLDPDQLASENSVDPNQLASDQNPHCFSLCL